MKTEPRDLTATESHLLAELAVHNHGRRIAVEFSIPFTKDVDAPVECVMAIIRDVPEHYVRDQAMRAQPAAAGLDGRRPDTGEAR